MTVKSKASKVKRKAQSNPVTTTGTIGVVVGIVGRYLGWDAQTIADISTLFLLSLPVVNFVTSHWFPSLGSSAEDAAPADEA